MEMVGGVLGIVLVVFLLVLSVCWVLLPFIIMARLTELRKSMDQINGNIENLMRGAQTYMNEMLGRQ